MPQVGPYDFSLNIPDPGQAFMQSFDAARNQRDQMTQQQNRQAQLQEFMGRLRQDRSPQMMAEFAIAFPEMAQAVTKAYEPLDAQVKQSRLQQQAQVYSALERGDVAGAKRIGEELLAAAKNTPGQEQLANEIEYSLEQLGTDPETLKIGLAVSIASGDPKLYETLFKQDTEKSYVVVPGVGVVLKRDIDAADKAAANGVKGVTVKTAIPQAAIDRLKKNPGAKAQFDEVFGAGSAASILGGGSGNATSGFRSEGN